jgi:hypothetical protein
MQILIISIDHFVQREITGHERDSLRVRKRLLESLLSQEIPRRAVQFIAEEADPKYRTIAQRLADNYDPRIPWKNIIMTEEERKQAHIYQALNNRPKHNEQRGNETVEIEHRIPEDDIREDFFVREILDGAGKSSSVLTLCGDMHVQAVKDKLQAGGQVAEINSSLISDKRWV